MSSALATPPARVMNAPPPVRFESLYQQHFGQVYRTLRRLGVASAVLDDAAQDVFVVVHRKLHSLHQPEGARAWIMAIAMRVASDYRRRGRRVGEPLTEELAAPASDPATEAETSQAVALLHELLAGLDESRRSVFVLVELEQLSAVEAAAALGVRLNTVYSRLRSARELFQSALARHRAKQSRLTGVEENQ